jgi:site-specific DNA recombinase
MVTVVYREVHTGAELFERPQLTLLREAMRRGEFDILLVHALDRLSRKQTHQGLILSEAEYARVAWDSVTEDIDNSPQGQILRAVIGGMAEMERLKIAERTVRGRMARARNGKLLPGPAPLFGYRWGDATKGAYAIDETTGPIVQRVFACVAGGETIRSIAAKLTAEGIPSPRGNAKWSPSTIHTMLKQPAYSGKGIAWKYATEKKPGSNSRVVVRPEHEHIQLPAGTVPQLIVPAMHEAVQERLRFNKQQAARHNSDPTVSLLRGGFIRCGYCGTVLSTTRKKGLLYYRHGTRQVDHHGCPAVHIRLEHIDGVVWEQICALIQQPEVIEYELTRLRERDPSIADLAIVDRHLAAIERKQSGLVKRLGDLDDDSAALVTAELNLLSTQKRELSLERLVVEQRQNGWDSLTLQLASFEALRNRVTENLSTLPYQLRRDLLLTLGVQVRLYHSNHDPRFEIVASLPIEDSIVSTTSSVCAACAGSERLRPACPA